ncbi:MAG: ABC transporter permease [Bacteroidales bacterium]|nr:ABC transporter permease [Bacteroidales bacterium]
MRQSIVLGWLKDAWEIATSELKRIFSDGGVVLIFFVAGMLYPLLYNIVYINGILEDTPLAVVDMADCSASRRYIREVDATRETKIAARCTTMEEAEKLMQERKVKGILYFPADFGDNLAALRQATVGVYCDMSSFLYYKNALMAVNHVMLSEHVQIQIERYAKAGFTDQEAAQLVQGLPYGENNPYNAAFSYSIFLVSAILLIIVQQTLFYGMSLLVGTVREKNHQYASLPPHLQGRGVGRVIFGRGSAYWLVYMGIAVYVAFIVPAIFGLPQRGNFWDILLLLAIFVTDCVFFSMVWSSFITRRESVFLLFLFMSPICLFLTGASWPTFAIPGFWKVFSYLLPSTFAVQAYLNMSVAGGGLTSAISQLNCLFLQMNIYLVLAFVAYYVEDWIFLHKDRIRSHRDQLDAKLGIDRQKMRSIIEG